MRISFLRGAFAVLALVTGLGLTACSSQRSGCDGCQAPRACSKWKPNCCNNWNWYDPCHTIEGNACGSDVVDCPCSGPVPTCP